MSMANSRLAFYAAALTSAVAPPNARAADPPLAMTPTSNWTVDYAEDSCALRRTFEGGADKMGLELRQFAPGDHLEIVLMSPTLPRTRSAPQARFEPDSGWSEPPYQRFLDGEGKQGVSYPDSLRSSALKSNEEEPSAWAPAERDAREQAVAALTVRRAFKREFTLQTGSMHAPMVALRKCMDELVTHWGLDPKVLSALSRVAEPIDPMAWARRAMMNYPTDMLRANKGARVPIRVIVGADGKPLSCAANKGYAEPRFEQAACGVTMQYARFKPALDADGTPVPSLFATTIAYAIAD